MTKYPIHKRIRYRIGLWLFKPRLSDLYRQYDSFFEDPSDVVVGIRWGLIIASRRPVSEQSAVGLLPPSHRRES